ncbi:unnamed protein product [Leptosia nina]|uniref:Uncharacterized protein n=1 Tax=Leptosia nina TaxID=320188 RepID=A0AAV1JW94_9NEOP
MPSLVLDLHVALITGAHRCQFPLAPNLSSYRVAHCRRRPGVRVGRSYARRLVSFIDSPRGALTARPHDTTAPAGLRAAQTLHKQKPTLRCDFLRCLSHYAFVIFRTRSDFDFSLFL